MKKLLYIFLNTFYESRNHKSLLITFLIACFFIWLLGFHIDLVWENGKIIQSQNSIWFGGEAKDYRLGLFFGYFSILLPLIFFSTGVIREALKPEFVTLWLINPISRKIYLTNKLLSLTFLIWLIFSFINGGLWLVMGFRYDIWVEGFWVSLWLIFLLCLSLNFWALFISLITKRTTTSAFFCLFFIVLIPICKPLLENNFGFANASGSFWISVLDVFSPELVENFTEVGRIVFNSSPDLSSVPYMIMIGLCVYVGSLYIFERKAIC